MQISIMDRLYINVHTENFLNQIILGVNNNSTPCQECECEFEKYAIKTKRTLPTVNRSVNQCIQERFFFETDLSGRISKGYLTKDRIKITVIITERSNWKISRFQNHFIASPVDLIFITLCFFHTLCSNWNKWFVLWVSRSFLTPERPIDQVQLTVTINILLPISQWNVGLGRKRIMHSEHEILVRKRIMIWQSTKPLNFWALISIGEPNAVKWFWKV